MTKEIIETMKRSFGILDERESISNFGNMAEPVMAICCASFILTEKGSVSTELVKEIFLKSLQRGEKDKTYDLSGKNSIFDFSAQADIHKKADDERSARKQQADFVDDIKRNIIDGKFEALKSRLANGGRMKPVKTIVNGKLVLVFMITLGKGRNPLLLKGKIQNLSYQDAKTLLLNKAKEFPGMMGNDKGEPISIGKGNVLFLYKVVDNKNEFKDVEMFEKDDEVADVEINDSNGIVPKLVISANHNVIPTIQDILSKGSGEKYDELINMIDTIAQYVIEGENDITKIRKVYLANTEKNIPSYLVIGMMGREGQTSDGKGHVKGDIQLSIKNSDGKTVEAIFSMKYGNHVVHNFSSIDTIVDSVNDVLDIAMLENPGKYKKEWKLASRTYKNVEAIVGINDGESVFQKTDVPRLYEILWNMKNYYNRSKMLFGFLERYATGKDKADILRMDKRGRKVHKIPALISDYMKYQEKNIVVDREAYVNMSIRDKSGVHGILKIKNQIIIDAGMDEFVEKVQKIFTQPRTDMWSLISYNTFMEKILSYYGDSGNISRLYAERTESMASHSVEIQRKFKNVIVPGYKEIMSDLDSLEFRKTQILGFMNGDVESIDPNEINSFVTIMIDKITKLYSQIKLLKVEK